MGAMWKIILISAIISCHKAYAANHVSCYYRNWAQENEGMAKFRPENIDPMLCPLIKYAFLKVNPVTFQLETTRAFDEENLRKLNDLKKINPRLKLVVAVGGWSHENVPRFSVMAKHKKSRHIFIVSVIDFLKRHKLDGLNYNWLYPAIRPKGALPSERRHFTLLLKETYQAFKAEEERFLLSATLSSSAKNIMKSYDILEIPRYVDNVEVIVQSLWGHWKGRTGSPTAMKGNQKTVTETIETLLRAEFPPSKLNIGFSMYGRTFKLESAENHHIGAKSIGPGPPGEHTKKEGMLAYYEICQKKWAYQAAWNSTESMTPYASKGDLWVAYDNPDSYKYKLQYLLRNYNLNGITLWAMDFDDFTGEFCNAGEYPLTRLIVDVVEAEKPTRCKEKVDIGFLLDSSGSVKDMYQAEKDLIKGIAASFGISQDGSRAGVITFSFWVKQSIRLNDHLNIIDFNNAVDAIPFMGHTTRIDLALKLTRTVLFTTENGTRGGNFPKLLVLITDGSQTIKKGYEDPIENAAKLREMGINILVIGLGPLIDPIELANIAGGQEHLIVEPTLDEILQTDIIERVRRLSCPKKSRHHEEVEPEQKGDSGLASSRLAAKTVRVPDITKGL